MIDLEEVRSTWLVQCGPCDYGIAGTCNCPQGDNCPQAEPRTVIGDLCDEVEWLRLRLDHAVTMAERWIRIAGGTIQ